MTTELLTTEARPGAIAAANRLAGRVWQCVELWLVRIGDCLNPILVKETRRALKSRQFIITFLLVLGACWVATIIGVAAIGPAIFYAAAGSTLLFSYFVILAFPLAIVVPYSAFRSLAAEREDNTYDVLSITALGPRQIISGKLGSATAQMAIYLSAVAPCLAFTYLLRGVDVLTIALLLVHSFLASLGLSMIGLFLATLSKVRYGQIFISVVFVAGLIGAFSCGIGLAMALLSEAYMYVTAGWFWAANLAWFTGFATTFALLFFAAASMITFASENRSTPLRIAMLVQQVCWVGWMGYIWAVNENSGRIVSFIVALFAGLYWYIMGTLLSSERPLMSERVKRRLPNSFLGRLLFSWFNPGPASGYVFVVANATAVAAVSFIGLAVSSWYGRFAGGRPTVNEIVYTILIGWGYLVAYLGVGLLIVSALRRVAAVSMIAGVLIQILLLMLGSGIPWTIQMMSITLRELDYSLLQITNPFWTLTQLLDRGVPLDANLILLAVSAAAFCVFVLNLPGVVRELRQVRIAPPPRVVEDELVLHPEPPPQPTSPWGDGVES